MKSTELYRLLLTEIGAPLKALGFKRQRSFLSWSRPLAGLNTVIWFQVSRDGWDEYAGSQFVVELQRSEGDEPGMPAVQRMRLAKLIDDEARERIRILQNDVIRSLHRAPSTYALFQVSPEVTGWYLKKFEQHRLPYDAAEDLWFRFAEPEHVKRWGKLIVELLPELLQGIEGAA
jgi:hypothetical protein